MNICWNGARFIAVAALVVSLMAPGVAYAGNGRKAYRKGMEHERALRWDRAAEQYGLALSEDPSNSEYKLRYSRAVTQASLMLTQRGDTLAAEKDYSAAYQAYRQALAYDQTNELAGAKMRYMMKLQGLAEPEENGPETKLLKAKYERRDATLQIPASRRIPTDVVYRATSLRAIIDSLSESLGISVIYDKEFKDEKSIDYEVRNTTKGKALELLLLTNKLFYVQADTRTIIVAPDQPQNRARYQNLSVRTFFLRNADVQEVRTLVQQIVATKYLVPNKQQNSLTVRDTPANLELIESLIASVDKDRAEVLIEVNFYEADHNDVLELGNQFNVDTKNPGSLATFIGGVGQADALRAITPAGVYGPIGLALALPSSTLKAFQSSGRTRLLASTQVHVLDNEQHTIRIGQRVPIQTASFIGTGTTVVTGNGQNQNQNNNNNAAFLGGPATQFQYENVGLNIDMQPVVHEDQVQIKMKIETSDVAENSGVGNNPIFTQRQMSSVASIKNGQTTLIAGVATENKSEGRQGLPLVSLLPVVGRFFTIPRQSRKLVDVVITVTPYILRAPVYDDDDHIAVPAGTSTAPDRQISIEEIVYRAELDEAAAAAPAIATTGASPPPTARPPAARPHVTEVEVPLRGLEVAKPVRADSADTISTPGGRAATPVVGPEDTAPPPKPAAQPPVKPSAAAVPAAVAPEPGVDEDAEDEDDGEFDDVEDPGDADPNAFVSMRLTGLQSAVVGKPMPVALWSSGSPGIANATVAIQFNEQLLRVAKVESTGMFDGKLGNKLPFEVRNGMLYISMTRPPEMAKSPVSGQLLNITFEVLGAGAATLAVNPTATKFVTFANAPATVRFDSPMTVVLR